MEHPLIVGVDGSESSLRAVDWAADEASRSGVGLRIVHASLWERYETAVSSADPESLSEQALAEDIAASAAERARLRAPGVEIRAEVLPEDAVSALLDKEHEATALVVGSRGRGAVAALLLGSVSLKVAARAHCPVFVVRGGKETVAGELRRVVLGVSEGEDPSAVRFAFAEAEARDCPLHVVTAWRAPAHPDRSSPLLTGGTRLAEEQAASDTLTEALREPMERHPGVTVEREVVMGSARKTLLEAAGTADLLVVGATRARGVPGLQLGSVSHALLHHSACPVGVVPRPA